MRLPWGTLKEIGSTFLQGLNYSVLGCLSFEERCCIVPEAMFSNNCQGIELLEVRDPADAFPDHSAEVDRKIAQNKKSLEEAGVSFQSNITDLLSSEDDLLDILDNWEGSHSCETIILDVTSLPKRYFCFFMKGMLQMDSFRNVIVTYSQAGPNGYTPTHLAEDPMTCDHLPGYAAPLPPKGDTLVISVGFESLSIRSLVDIYQDRKRGTKIILSFPPDGGSAWREWNTLKQIALGDPQNIIQKGIEVISLWDAEHVYQLLERWDKDADGLTLAPFGPKPHTLGMALFAIRHDCGLYYTQPKSYNPDYSRGRGETWAYLVKWEGMPCFDRQSKQP